MKYEPVIGLEIHAQLKTNTKLFCPCSIKFGAGPNTQTCPVCLGMPGVLPVLNETAVRFAVMMAHAINSTVNPESVFARKNYFYPDLPKGYQISQYDKPLCERGYLDIETKDGVKRIGITRIHMEEDAGKLLHGESSSDVNSSLVDLNRAGTPLIEIVSEPDIRNSEEASAYFKSIRDILLYLDISDGNMQEGSLRCDANVSVRPVGEKKFGTRTELKNINSFKFLRDAIEYEIERQINAIEDGERIVQETRLFDPASGKTRTMRSKEEAHDYRYFPEPDLKPLIIDEKEIARLKETLPTLPAQMKEKFVNAYGLSSYDAGVLTSSKAVADFYEQSASCAVSLSDSLQIKPKTISNWITGEQLRLLNEKNLDISESKVKPTDLIELIAMVEKGEINQKTGKEVFEEMFTSGKKAAIIVKEKGAGQISDSGAIEKAVDDVIAKNPNEAKRFKEGEEKLLSFFVGQIMKAMKGRANPQTATDVLKKKLLG
ncbi:MAG: Asp-tRNA(Asn)/Glu-tRNA(Gln) amidotransferase subunit GatB [Deltaproteobacteria bacterium]|nr:Asp-tRNA(Asn)/Glu-tRNA(Gln) amidotransferase subunit GatB [Deltaproteobacteria bacterium]